MSPKELYEYCGRNKSEVGRMLGANPATVAGWFVNGEIPEGRQYQAQLATNGALKADLPADRRPVGEQIGVLPAGAGSVSLQAPSEPTDPA